MVIIPRFLWELQADLADNPALDNTITTVLFAQKKFCYDYVLKLQASITLYILL